MKQHLALFLVLFSFLSFTQVAEAKRFGGGKSFGYSKQMKPKQYNQKQTPAQKPAAQPQGSKAAGNRLQSGASKWLGPLAGFAAGGLLAAMLFGDGFEGIQLFDILLIALVAFILFKLFARRQPQPTYAGHGTDDDSQTYQPAPTQHRETAPTPEYNPHAGGSIIGSGLSADAQPVAEAPDWFDQAAFLDGSKQHFVAVQKAWDELNLDTIRDYCSPELFAELQQEMSMMQPHQNHTEVDTLYAEMADMAIDGDYFVASVRFNGFIKEEQGGAAHAFNEVWHIRRLAVGEGDWQIAGIQQS